MDSLEEETRRTAEVALEQLEALGSGVNSEAPSADSSLSEAAASDRWDEMHESMSAGAQSKSSLPSLNFEEIRDRYVARPSRNAAQFSYTVEPNIDNIKKKKYIQNISMKLKYEMLTTKTTNVLQFVISMSTRRGGSNEMSR